MLTRGWTAEYVRLSDNAVFRLPLAAEPTMKRNYSGTAYDTAQAILTDPAGAIQDGLGLKNLLRLYDDGVLQFQGYLVKTRAKGGLLTVDANSANFLLWKRYTRRWPLVGVNDLDVLRALFDKALESDLTFSDTLEEWATATQVASSENALFLKHNSLTTYYASGSLQGIPLTVAGDIRRARIDADATSQRTRFRTDPFNGVEALYTPGHMAFLDAPSGVVRAPSAYTTPSEPLTDVTHFPSMVNTVLRDGKLQLADSNTRGETFEGGIAGIFAPPTGDAAWSGAGNNLSSGNNGGNSAFYWVLNEAYGLVSSPASGSFGGGTWWVRFSDGASGLISTGAPYPPGGTAYNYFFRFAGKAYARRYTTPATVDEILETTPPTIQSHTMAGFAGQQGDEVYFEYGGVLNSVRSAFSGGSYVHTYKAYRVATNDWLGTYQGPTIPSDGPIAYGGPDGVAYTSPTGIALWDGVAWLITSNTAAFPSGTPSAANRAIYAFWLVISVGVLYNLNFYYSQATTLPVTGPTGTGQGSLSLHLKSGQGFSIRGYPDSLVNTVAFQIYKVAGKSAHWRSSGGDYICDVSTAGVVTVNGTVLTETLADGQWNEIIMEIDSRLTNPTQPGSANVYVRGFFQGSITGNSATPLGLFLFGRLGTADANQDFYLDGFTITPVIGGLGGLTGSAIWKSPIQAANVNFFEYTTSPDGLVMTTPPGSGITVEVSLDNGATWQPSGHNVQHSTLLPSQTFVLVRFTLSASLDGAVRPTLDVFGPHIGAGYVAGAYTIATLDLEPDTVRGDFFTIMADTVQAVPAGTAVSYRVTSDGGAHWTAAVLGVEVQIAPAEVGTDVRVEITVSGTASVTAYVSYLDVKYREAGGNTSVVIKVSRDGGATFHAVNAGAWFDLTPFTSESPKNQFVVRFELATTVNTVTPQVSNARYSLVQAGFGLVQLMDPVDLALAAWPLREASGLTAASIREDVASLTLPVPSPTWLPAPYGGLSFPGTVGYHASLLNVVGLTAYPFTLEAWVKATDLPGATTRGALSLAKQGNATKGYAVGVKDGNAYLYAHDGTTDGSISVAYPDLVPGALVHIAAVFTSATRRDLYVNGRPVGSSTANVTYFTPDAILLGALTAATGANPWKGEIHYPTFHGSALSQATMRLHGKGPGVWPLAGTYNKTYEVDSRATGLQGLQKERNADAWWWLDPSTGIYYLFWSSERPAAISVDLPTAVGDSADADAFKDADHFTISGV